MKVYILRCESEDDSEITVTATPEAALRLAAEYIRFDLHNVYYAEDRKKIMRHLNGESRLTSKDLSDGITHIDKAIEVYNSGRSMGNFVTIEEHEVVEDRED